MNCIKTILLSLFVLSLPFDYYNQFGLVEFVSISKSIGIIYFFVSVIDYKVSMKLSRVGYYLFPLVIIWILLTAQSFLHDFASSRSSVINMTMLQGLILFWFVFNDIKAERIDARWVMVSWVLGLVALSILIPFGFGVEIKNNELSSSRVFFFGLNPNTLGLYANIAIVFVLGMVTKRKNYFGRATILLIALLPNLLLLIGMTGSRSALLIAGVSVIATVLLLRLSVLKRLFSYALGTILIFYSYREIMSVDVMSRRVTKTVNTGDIGERSDIWSLVFNLGTEAPLFGVGQTGFEKKMIFEYGRYMDPHNLFLYLFVTTGIVGLVLYFYVLLNVFRAAKSHYLKTGIVVMPVLFVVYVANILKSGGVIGSKAMWLMLALIASSSFQTASTNNKIKGGG